MAGAVSNYRRPRSGSAATRAGAARVLQAAFRMLSQRSRAKSAASWRKRVRKYENVPAKKKRKLVRGRPMFTMGTYRGKFKKGYSLARSKFDVACVTYTQEKGTTVTNSDCVYIGHAVAVRVLLKTVLGALVKKLFTKAGHRVASLGEKFQGQLLASHVGTDTLIRTQFRTGQDGPVSTQDVICGADQTYEEIIENLKAQLLGAGSTVTEYEFIQMQLVVGSHMAASISMVDCYIKCDYWSKLNVQNQTKGAGSLDDQMTDVTNNPLEGRSYWGFGTGFTPKLYDPVLALTAENNFVADFADGIISFDVNGTNVSSEMKNVLKRPASAAMFGGCRKMGKVRLSPGGIKRGVLKGEIAMDYNKLLRKLLPHLRATTAAAENQRAWLGTCELFGLEKLCRTGTGDQDITVGVEVNQSYRCAVYERRRRTLAQHIVN